MRRRYSRGLGLVAGDLDTTAPVCTSWYSKLDPFCWGVLGAAAATGQMNSAGNFDTTSSYSGVPPPPAPMPPPAPVPTADNSDPLTLPPASGAAAQGTIDATIAAGDAANKAMYQAFYASLPSGCQSTIFPSLGICDTAIYWGAGILGLLGFVYMAGGRRR